MFVIGSMGDGRAGTEKNLLTILEHIDRAEFEPYLICLQDSDYTRAGNFICDTQCLHLHSMFTPKMWNIRRKLAQRMSELEVKIAQTFFVEGHIVGGGAARKAGVSQIISSRRNLGYSYTRKELLYLKVANRYPTRYLANSHAVADAIARLESTDIHDFDVIYNGVPDFLETTPRAPAEDTAVMVANLRPVKRIGDLVEAARIVVGQIPRARFLLVGDGPMRKTLEAQVTDLGLREVVTFTGSVDDVSTVIVQASIGVLTSESEGCSNAILEYMRSALPVVATDVGGNPELVIDGDNGSLVPVGNIEQLAARIIDLMENKERARLMGERGRELWQHEYSVAAMIEHYQDYYRSLLKRTS